MFIHQYVRCQYVSINIKVSYNYGRKPTNIITMCFLNEPYFYRCNIPLQAIRLIQLLKFSYGKNCDMILFIDVVKRYYTIMLINFFTNKICLLIPVCDRNK